MKDVNKIILLGRLGADPDQRQTKSGTQLAQLSVATSRRIPKESPDALGGTTFVEETQWHKVIVWGRQGEACSQYLKKGNPIYVEGYLKTRQYEDKNGLTRTSVEVHAENISFLDVKKQKTIENLPIEPAISASA